MWLRVRTVIVVLTLLLCALTRASAGLPSLPGIPPLPKPPIPSLPKLPDLPIPDISQFLRGEDAVSTSFADAVTSVPFLNAYQPPDASFLPSSSRLSSGGYEVPSGSYVFNGRSYCLHAGKHVSVRGSGYLWAPLKGSKAQIIETILRKSADHLEIPQTEVQQLIWAIQARARMNNLSPTLQADAVKLLSPAQILLLNSSALGIVPEDKL